MIHDHRAIREPIGCMSGRLRVGIVATIALLLIVRRRTVSGIFLGARYIAACILQVMVRLGFRQRCCGIVSRGIGASPSAGTRAQTRARTVAGGALERVVRVVLR